MIDLTPGSPEWARRVSPSKVAAILGISPWDSQRSMFHKMRGEVPWDEETEAMERGTLCEPAVLAWWRKHHEHTDWAEQVTYELDDWCVATPDAVTGHDGQVVIIEAKTAAKMDDWGQPETDEIPTYYLSQVYASMAVARRCGVEVTAAHVPVLGGYRLAFSNYVVPYDADICDDILGRMKAWADTLAADEPPELDDSLATYEAIRRVHPDIDMDATVELDPYEAETLLQAVLDYDEADATLRLCKSSAIDRMGTARFAVCNGVKVARRQPNKSGVSFVALPKNLPLLTELENAS